MRDFDKDFDVKGLLEDVEKAKEGTSEYEDIPQGSYEVRLLNVELRETKKEPIRPMLSVEFEIIEGKYKKSHLWYNQLMNTGYGIHNACEFLRSLQVGDIEFKTFKDFVKLLEDIDVDSAPEYALEYGQNKKGFNTYKITEVFED